MDSLFSQTSLHHRQSLCDHGHIASKLSQLIGERKVDRCAGLIAHVRTLSLARHDQALFLKHCVSALDSAQGHSELGAYLVMVRKLLPQRDLTVSDPAAKHTGHLFVAGPGIVSTESVHVRTVQLSKLDILLSASLTSLSMMSNVSISGYFRSRKVRSNTEAPVGVGAPAGAVHRMLGASMQVEGTRLYRVRDVAEHFDVSVATIYRAIESGQLAALKLGTGKGTLRVTGTAVLAYQRACARAVGWMTAEDLPTVVTG